MCGRFGFTLIAGTWSRYEIEKPPTHISSRYNISPSQKAVVVTRHSPNQASLMQFGLIPFWAKENKKYLINAKTETVFEKVTFKKAVVERRAIIPATHFFEWHEHSDPKIPYVFKAKFEKVFSLAGIWGENEINGKTIKSFAILTTHPNSKMAKIHHRQPVILTREQEDEWLDPDMVEPERIKVFFDPIPSDSLDCWPVSRKVNNPLNDGPDLIEKVEPT